MNPTLPSVRRALSFPGLVTMPIIFGAEGYPDRDRFDLMLLQLDWPVLDRIFAAYALARRHMRDIEEGDFVALRSRDMPDTRLELPVDLPVSMHRSVILEEFGWIRDDLQNSWAALPARFPCEVLGDGDIGCGAEAMWTGVCYVEPEHRFAVRLHTFCAPEETPLYFDAILPLERLHRLHRGLAWDGDLVVYD